MLTQSLTPTPSISVVNQSPPAIGPGAAIKSWSVGQLLNATVVASPARGPVLLEVGGQPLAARASTQFAPGDTLTLRVLTTSAPPQLQIIERNPAHATSLSAALRIALPRQGDLGPLMVQLTSLTALTARRNITPALPEPLTELARAIVAGLARPAELGDAKRLQQLISRSGVHLEAYLRTQLEHSGSSPGSSFKSSVSSHLNGDLKANLVRLEQFLALHLTTAAQDLATGRGPRLRTVSEHRGQAGASLNVQQRGDIDLLKLHKQVKGGLHRIVSNQLLTLQSEGTVRNGLHVDLPIRLGELIGNVSLRIDRDESNSTDQDGTPTLPVWSVNLRLDPPGLGPVDARITLRDDAVTTTFWAQSGSAAELIAKHVDELHEALSRCGLEPGVITICRGAKPVEMVATQSGQLLVEQA